MLKRTSCLIYLLLACLVVSSASAQSPYEDQIQYLSGTGNDDTVEWEFFCTGGRRSGYWTTISVPSNWETQGFGQYNYGHDRPKADEQGRYRTSFELPSGWQDRRIIIVFEAVMTDTAVYVNGQSAGPIHQGGFYQFEYDITDLVRFDQENLLEVNVSKVSANDTVENTERQGDYWVFGGIYRPVFLKARPQQHIDWVAIDAKADGSFYSDVYLKHIEDADNISFQIYDDAGNPVTASISQDISGGQEKAVLRAHVPSPNTWSAETPNLYNVMVRLQKGNQVLHEVTERFGFRTIEVREGDGIYVNGRKIRMAGVNRHAFWPDTGRTLNREINYRDAELLKSMNVNAVRMSHYPPDKAFLEAADELGLYIINELAGWHDAYDTTVGRQLVYQMVRRDTNHPSILLWANGNEGGHNHELVEEYGRHDPQDRVVIHPTPSWEPPTVFNAIDTAHYCGWDAHYRRLTEGNDIFLPTEFLHALYDGGAGAGMYDYWNAIKDSPLGAGGFIWAMLDEGSVRTDEGGWIDNDGNHAPDGIFGPYREKSGSFYTLKEIWSPVQVMLEDVDESFDGTIMLGNEYAFTNLNQCTFEYRWVNLKAPQMDGTKHIVRKSGSIVGPDVQPGQTGQITIEMPAEWQQPDVLYLISYDPTGRELFTWSWPIKSPACYRSETVTTGDGTILVNENDDTLELITGPFAMYFDLETGQLVEAARGGETFSFGNGPVFVPESATRGFLNIRSATARSAQWPHEAPNAIDANMATRWSSQNDTWILLDMGRENTFSEIQIAWQRGNQRRFTFEIEVSADEENWSTVFSGQSTGTTSEPEPYKFEQVQARYVRIIGKGNTENNWTSIHHIQVPCNKPVPEPVVAHRSDDDGNYIITSSTDQTEFQWTLYPSGWLQLDYSMELDGEFHYAGVTFDYPEDEVLAKSWLGDGPYRVWKNRMKGTRFDMFDQLYNDPMPGRSWAVPEFKGYFSNMHWLVLNTRQGDMTVMTDTRDLYLRLFTPRWGHNPKGAVAAMPQGDISFLNAISAIGTKFRTSGHLGPQSQRTVFDSDQIGATLYFRFENVK